MSQTLSSVLLAAQVIGCVAVVWGFCLREVRDYREVRRSARIAARILAYTNNNRKDPA